MDASSCQPRTCIDASGRICHCSAPWPAPALAFALALAPATCVPCCRWAYSAAAAEANEDSDADEGDADGGVLNGLDQAGAGAAVLTSDMTPPDRAADAVFEAAGILTKRADAERGVAALDALAPLPFVGGGDGECDGAVGKDMMVAVVDDDDAGGDAAEPNAMGEAVCEDGAIEIAAAAAAAEEVACACDAMGEAIEPSALKTDGYLAT